MNTTIIVLALLFQIPSNSQISDDFTPKYRFLFKNNAKDAIAVHTAVIEVKKAWVFEPLVPPQAPLPPSQIVPVILSPDSVPYDITKSLSLALKPGEIDHVQFNFTAKSKKISEPVSMVFLLNIKLMYGDDNKFIESNDKLVFVKGFGSGFGPSIDDATKTMRLLVPNLSREKVAARANSNIKKAKEVKEIIGKKIAFNNKLDEFLEKIIAVK